MDAERWTSRWEPSRDARPSGSGTGRGLSHNRTDPPSYSSNASLRQTSFADTEERWNRRNQGQDWGNRADKGRSSNGRDSSDFANQRHEPRQHQARYTHQYRRQHCATAGPGTNWVGRPKHEAVLDLETDLMGDAFGGLDPGGPELATLAGRGPGGQDSDPWFEHATHSSGSGSGFHMPGRAAIGLTLPQLEEAVLGGETRTWSLERLAEAAAAVCHLRAEGATVVELSPFSRQEEAIMDAIATAAIYAARRGPDSSAATPGPSSSSSPIGWAVAQLLWSCARGQYWGGPPKPRPGTCAVSAAAAAAATAVAAVSLYGSDDAAEGGSGTVGRTVPESWPSLRSRNSGSAEAAEAIRQDRVVGSSSGGGGVNGGKEGGAAEAANGNAAVGNGVSDGSAGHWRPLAVELMHLLAADGCRLVGQLESNSLSLVWWALAKAAAAAREKHGGGGAHQHPATAAAAAVLAAATAPLIAALDSRAAAELKQTNNAKLCALLYSCACVNKSSEQQLQVLGDELAERLEHAVLLAEAGIEGLPRRRFSSRELSCVAYSCGLLGLRHEKLMTSLSEYAAATAHSKWSASAISVFMYGIANVGHRDQRLMAWADTAISAKPASDFNLRNISFLLYNFHRLRWWPHRAAEHLLSATRLHSPPSIPLISVSTILMCMGSGRARDERALAHLCDALTRRPTDQLSCKDVCICLTALQRLHGEDVLASQQPEVLAALDHLVAAILERGFSRPIPSCRAVPVFNHQEVSNAMFAMGKLKYYSPAVLDALRNHAARGGLEGASAWDCTAILVGLAHLNYDVRSGTGTERGEHGGGGGRPRRGQAGAAPEATARTGLGPGANAAGVMAAAAEGSGGGVTEVDLVEVLAGTVARRVRTAKSQDLANTLWSLTVLEGALETYRSIVTALLDEVNRRGPQSRNPDGFNVDEQRQLWQVHRELAALPQPYATLREDLVRLGKLGMSEADHTYSRVQASFQSLLSAMHTCGRFPRLKDLLFEQELVPGGEQLMRIDVQAVIERPSPGGGSTLHRVAIEFDGPFHFMVNEPYAARIDGRTALRNRILTRHLGEGNLVCVSMSEWVAASREPPVNGLPGRWRLMASKMGLWND